MLSTTMKQDQEFLEFSGRNRYVNLPDGFGLKFKIIMPKGSGKKTQFILKAVNSPATSKLFFVSKQKSKPLALTFCHNDNPRNGRWAQKSPLKYWCAW